MTAPDDIIQGSTALPHPGRERAPLPRALGVELGLFLLLIAAGALLGLLFGAVWHWLAPQVPMHSDGTAIYLNDPEGEQAIGADGVFAVTGAVFGLVTGAAVYLATRARQGGVGVVLGLVGGALLGGCIAWGGGWSEKAYQAKVVGIAKSVPTGQTFHGPLELTTKLGLVAWPIAALLVLMVLTALFTPRPEPRPLPWDTTPPAAPQDAPGTS